METLVDEIDHPYTGLVSRNFLHADVQTLRTELKKLRADLIGAIWRIFLTALGIQVVLVGVLVAILIEMLTRDGMTVRAIDASGAANGGGD